MVLKKDKNPSKKKDRYQIRNWREYNQSLVNRGSLTFWFDEEAIEKWHKTEKSNKPGRPEVYSDFAVCCGLAIKAVFRIALRALQGLIGSLLKIMKLPLKCPNYSLFSRRAKDLKIPMRRLLKPGEHLNIVFDSTGLKVYGEGEWKVRKHGYSKQRTWRKVHIGMCTDTGQVVISAVTSNGVSDDAAMLDMLDVLGDVKVGNVFGDGAYDTTDCRQFIHDLGGKQIIPPKRTAKPQRKNSLPALKERDDAIERIKELGDEGRAKWKQEIGYHQRSLVETHMFRHKTILGDRLTTRKEETQATEVAIKCDVLNRMAELGMPDSYKVAV